MYHKILLAYDGSPGAKRALDVVVQLALLTHAEVWALAVEERLLHLAATIDEQVASLYCSVSTTASSSARVLISAALSPVRDVERSGRNHV